MCLYLDILMSCLRVCVLASSKPFPCQLLKRVFSANALQAAAARRCHSLQQAALKSVVYSSSKPMHPMHNSSSSSRKHFLQPIVLQRSQCSTRQSPRGLSALPAAKQQWHAAPDRQQLLPSSSSSSCKYGGGLHQQGLQQQQQQQQQSSARLRLPPLRATFAAGGDDGLVDPKPQVRYVQQFVGVHH
jgi:hypothetical protein